MKIMTDTNILFSSLLFPNSSVSKTLMHISDKHSLYLCDYIIAETTRNIEKKRPDLLPNMQCLLDELSYKLVIAPKNQTVSISDPKDQPILNAAVLANVDIIISGDKLFLSLELSKPLTMSVAQFNEYESNNRTPGEV